MTYSGDYIPCAEKCSYPLRFGNRIRPLIDGAPAFRRICETVEEARHSVWVTVAFIDPGFLMPDDRGSFFDVLDRAKGRGLDVRVIFWRSPGVAALDPDSHFHGSTEHREFLASRGSIFLARWDRSVKYWCHHQKSWLIDAGQETEVAFVGGINLGVNSMVAPSHDENENGSTHDVYVEIQGPAATDVHHNFVQRWNEAGDKDLPDDSWPENAEITALSFPESLTPPAGDVPVQISRTVRRESYSNTIPAPDAEPFPIVKGEHSCLEQYAAAIDAARETIYIEDQALGSALILEKMEKALKRGVAIVYVLPGVANEMMVRALDEPRSRSFFKRLQSLGSFPNFTMAALASTRGPGKYLDVYVHAKIAIVDGFWATIGSCNVADRSYYSDTELNASFWHTKTVQEFRNALFNEHLGVDVTHMDDLRALKYFREVSGENTLRRVRGEDLQGLAFQLDPKHYPSEKPWLPKLD